MWEDRRRWCSLFWFIGEATEAAHARDNRMKKATLRGRISSHDMWNTWSILLRNFCAIKELERQNAIDRFVAAYQPSFFSHGFSIAECPSIFAGSSRPTSMAVQQHQHTLASVTRQATAEIRDNDNSTVGVDLPPLRKKYHWCTLSNPITAFGCNTWGLLFRCLPRFNASNEQRNQETVVTPNSRHVIDLAACRFFIEKFGRRRRRPLKQQ
jgi:hypothetical protein